jgi:hypothetical protein
VHAVVKCPFAENAPNSFTGKEAVNPLQGLCPRSYLTSVPIVLNLRNDAASFSEAQSN